MTTRAVIHWPSDRLRDVSALVLSEELGTDALKQLASDLYDTMAERKGVGLSAIQVGVAKRLFVIDGETANLGGGDWLAFVNPVVVSVGKETEAVKEGCLSLPHIFVPLPRPNHATVKALNLQGEEFTVEAEGMYARALLHEMDHLDGKTIPDYLTVAQRDMIRRKLKSRARRNAR
jgi:peptide deformylase